MWMSQGPNVSNISSDEIRRTQLSVCTDRRKIDYKPPVKNQSAVEFTSFRTKRFNCPAWEGNFPAPKSFRLSNGLDQTAHSHSKYAM